MPSKSWKGAKTSARASPPVQLVPPKTRSRDWISGRPVSRRSAERVAVADSRSEDLARAEELARRFRADLERPLGQLSRGNRQKVGLILALFHRPELLILDEPTSGLDPLMQEEFLSLVREERERGCAVFLSSHELDEVERVCDRVRDHPLLFERRDLSP